MELTDGLLISLIVLSSYNLLEITKQLKILNDRTRAINAHLVEHKEMNVSRLNDIKSNLSKNESYLKGIWDNTLDR